MSQIRPFFVRVLSALGLALLVGALGGSCGSSPPPRVAGIPEFQQLALRPVPGAGAGAVVNVVARNLLVSRTDLSLDTRLGTHNLGATYNAATGAWLWTFDITYDGQTFVDDTGAVFDTTGVASGEAIPGTHWVVVDGATLKTKGGLLHAFDAAGRLAAVRWASAPWPRVVFASETVAGAPRTTQIDQCTASDACTELFSLSYDGAGRLVGVTDRAGRQAAFTYDADGRLATARDGLDVAKGWPGFRYEYINGKIAAITNSEGERVEYRFTSKRLEVEAIGAEHPLHVFRYAGETDGLHTTEITDPEGHVLRYRWDGQRRLHALESVDTGETTTFAWSGARPTERVLPDGVTTTWLYEADDVATELQPSGNVVSFTYAPGAVDRARPTRRPIARIEDSLGLVEERSYDDAGRLVAITNGAGETTTFAYGPDEMLASRTDPAGVTSGFAGYGDHGHPTEITRSGSEGSTTRVYDAVGNLLERRGEIDIGGVARREYDADRNVAEVHLRGLPDHQQGPVEILTIEHRSDGRRTRILRPHGDDAEFAYDALGRLVERREKADGVWHGTIFERDALGRVTATQRPNGMRQEMTYDALGREATRTIGWGDPIAPETTASFTYEDGRRVEILDSAHGAPEKITYDSAGRPKVISYPGGELLMLGYDLRSRVTVAGLWIPGLDFTRTIELAYDGAGREISVSDAGQEVLARVYEAGLLAETHYGNGLVRSYGYAADGTLANADMVDANGTVIEATALSFDSSLVGSTRETPGGLIEGALTLYELRPSPDQSSNLPAAPRVTADTTPSHSQSWYYYDALSNVTSSPDTMHLYNSEHNRLLWIESENGFDHSYAYDEAGYVIERDGVPLTWDGAGRITSIGADGAFAWDTLGRPVSSTVMGVTRTHRFGGLVTADPLGNPVSLSLGEVTIDLVTGSRRYHHLDFRGNVAFVTDDNGAIVTHYLYKAYGVAAVVGEVAEGPSFARGRALGDLVLLGHRVLDSEAGRFLSPDPIYQLINQYAYAFGNPVRFWDPSGREPSLTPAQTVSVALAGVATQLATAAIVLALTPGGQGASVLLGKTALVVGGLGLGILLGEAILAELGSLGEGGGPGGGGGGGSGGGRGGSGGGGGGSGPQQQRELDLFIEVQAGVGSFGGIPEVVFGVGHGAPTAAAAGGGGGGCAPVALTSPVNPATLYLLAAFNLLLGLRVMAVRARRRSRPRRHGRRGTWPHGEMH